MVFSAEAFFQLHRERAIDAEVVKLKNSSGEVFVFSCIELPRQRFSQIKMFSIKKDKEFAFMN